MSDEHTYSEKQLVSTSKFLSLVLRHRPQSIGVTLDSEGWLDLHTLIDQANRTGKKLSRELILYVVATNDKQRFAISDDGFRIRANQGHSIREVQLDLVQIEPPTVLFHGTVDKFMNNIRSEGLRKRKRNHVHLSADVPTATKVGARRGAPVILKVDAARMHADGFAFFRSENGVWLTDHVPAKYLEPIAKQSL